MAARRALKLVNYKSLVSLCFLFLPRSCLLVLAKDDSVRKSNISGVNRLMDCTDTSGYKSPLYGLTKNLTRPKFLKSQIPYTVGKGCSTFQIQHMSLQLLVSDDVQTNPGPVKNPCSVCAKSASINHRKLTCSRCKLQCHIGPKCGNIPQHQYMNFSEFLYLIIAYHKNTFVCLNTAITRINKTETSAENTNSNKHDEKYVVD